MFVKLTDADGTTHGATRWDEGVRHSAAPGKLELCTPTCIHFYEDELLAALMNPAHGNFKDPLAFRFEPEGKVVSDGTRSGCRAGTTMERVSIPIVSRNQRIRFAILCALEVYEERGFVEWANGWLSGKDRTTKSAYDAAYAAYDAAYAQKSGKRIDFINLAHRAVSEEA